MVVTKHDTNPGLFNTKFRLNFHSRAETAQNAFGDNQDDNIITIGECRTFICFSLYIAHIVHCVRRAVFGAQFDTCYLLKLMFQFVTHFNVTLHTTQAGRAAAT